MKKWPYAFGEIICMLILPIVFWVGLWIARDGCWLGYIDCVLTVFGEILLGRFLYLIVSDSKDDIWPEAWRRDR